MSDTNGSIPIGEAAQAREQKAAAPVPKLSVLSEAEIQALAKGMVRYLREGFAPEIMEKFVEPLVKSQVRRLEQRIRAIEERPLLEDCGVWNKNSDYHPGMCVTFDGSMWVSKTWHRNGQPGKTDDWRLMVKRGKDGRDATGSR